MPLEFIPNQPFIFEELLPDQPCLNNDNRAYSQIVQPNDTICVQQIMTPCASAINCEPDMFSPAAALGLSGSLGSGWSFGGGLTSYTGSGGVVGNVTYTPSSPLVAGNPYQIDLTVDSVTGTAGIFVSLGLDTYATEITEAGTYVFYLIPQTTADTMVFTMNASADTAGDTMVISNVALSTFPLCWFDSLPFGYPSWNYTFDLPTLQGKFCSITDFGQLTNTTAYTTDGNYHRVNLTITDCTQGGLEVTIGGTYIGTTSGNGEFKFYGVPNDASGELILTKTGDFDGCVNYVTVDDFGFLDPAFLSTAVYRLQVANPSGLAQSDEIEFTLYDDRITWCFNVSELTNGGNPIELSCDINYKLLLTADCGEGATEYTSITTLRYNPDSWDCTFVVEAYSDGYNLGFYFGATTAPVFKLVQRLRILQFAPKYPTTSEEYLFSSGEWSRSFAQRGKIRTAWFDYVDEATHDVISTQIICDVLTIDGDVYYCPVKDYEPEWDEHRYNLAQSRVDIIKATEPTIYKRSC